MSYFPIQVNLIVDANTLEEAQIKAATMQSVLDYAVEQFTEHKDELERDIVEKTTALIEERQTEIKEFLMTEKERYLASIGIQED
jgi:hypothetical protein